MRSTSCSVVDDHGRKLVQFCERTGLVFCTGHVPDDRKALSTRPGGNAGLSAASTTSLYLGKRSMISKVVLCHKAVLGVAIRNTNL